MRPLLLTILLSAALFDYLPARAQGASSTSQHFYLDEPARRPPLRPRTVAGGRPSYGGVYLDGQQVTELNCYRFKRFDVVVPHFGWFASIEQLAIVVQVYSFDAKGRPLSSAPEYRQVLEFSGPRLQALRRTFADKGYLVFSQQEFTLPLSRVQYTKLPLASIAESVLVVDVHTLHISQTRPDGSPFYTEMPVYQSPRLPLRGRLAAPTSDQPPLLPSVTADSCRTNQGPLVPLATIRAVPFQGHGEKFVQR